MGAYAIYAIIGVHKRTVYINTLEKGLLLFTLAEADQGSQAPNFAPGLQDYRTGYRTC
jgi:hypothetical protein